MELFQRLPNELKYMIYDFYIADDLNIFLNDIYYYHNVIINFYIKNNYVDKTYYTFNSLLMRYLENKQDLPDCGEDNVNIYINNKKLYIHFVYKNYKKIKQTKIIINKYLNIKIYIDKDLAELYKFIKENKNYNIKIIKY